jgi:hypothetical protein
MASLTDQRPRPHTATLSLIVYVRATISEACLNVEAVWKLRVGAEAYYLQHVAHIDVPSTSPSTVPPTNFAPPNPAG